MNKGIFFALCLISASVFARPLTIQTQDEARHFDIEVADTPSTQTRGLMFRDSLAPSAGMLFITNEDRIWNMWMKNTLIPLDMIFIDMNGQIVKIAPNAKPHDLTLISSDIPVRAVLEIGGGQARVQNITVGNKVVLPAKP